MEFKFDIFISYYKPFPLNLIIWILDFGSMVHFNIELHSTLLFLFSFFDSFNCYEKRKYKMYKRQTRHVVVAELTMNIFLRKIKNSEFQSCIVSNRKLLGITLSLLWIHHYNSSEEKTLPDMDNWSFFIVRNCSRPRIRRLGLWKFFVCRHFIFSQIVE